MPKNPLKSTGKSKPKFPVNKPPKSKKPKLPKPTQNLKPYKSKSISAPKAKKPKPPAYKRQLRKNETARRKVLQRIERWVEKGYTFDKSVYEKIGGATADEIKETYGGAKLQKYFATKPPKAPKEKAERANQPKPKKPKKISYDRIKANERKKAEAELREERKRVNQRIRRLQKRGYYFDPDELSHIRDLTMDELRERFGRDTVYNRGVWIDKSTGEVIQGTTRRGMERREAARKAAETRAKKKGRKSIMPHEEDIVLGNFHAEIDEMFNTVKSELHGIVDSAVAERGKEEVCRSIKKNIDELREIMKKLEVSPVKRSTNWTTDTNLAVTRFVSLIYERALTSEELRRYADMEDLSETENRYARDDWYFEEYDDDE